MHPPAHVPRVCTLVNAGGPQHLRLLVQLCSMLIVGLSDWEQEREDRRRERLDKEAKDLRSLFELRGAELKARSAQLASASEKGDNLEDALRAQRLNTEKSLSELDTMRGRMLKAEGELQDQQGANASKLAENTERQVELRRTDQEIASVRQAAQQLSKLKEAQQKRLNVIDQERAVLNKDHETLKTQVPLEVDHSPVRSLAISGTCAPTQEQEHEPPGRHIRPPLPFPRGSPSRGLIPMAMLTAILQGLV